MSSPKTKRLVFERAGFICEYCLALLAYSPQPFDVEHIIPLSKNGEEIGITEIGRATVEALDLNRIGLVNFRRALLKLGVHPPK